ncbi:MAG: hypothetical protein U0R78_07310 [Nocardioidaceae bacterium]
MGFLDKAKAAANDLKASVDQQLSSSNASRDAEKHYRDLGMLAYLKETGRPIVDADWQRVFEALRAMESQGVITSFALQTTPPPPPGAVAAGQAAPPPPPGAAAPPPPPPGAAARPAAAPGRHGAPPPAAPVTPPPPAAGPGRRHAPAAASPAAERLSTHRWVSR